MKRFAKFLDHDGPYYKKGGKYLLEIKPVRQIELMNRKHYKHVRGPFVYGIQIRDAVTRDKRSVDTYYDTSWFMDEWEFY